MAVKKITTWKEAQHAQERCMEQLREVRHFLFAEVGAFFKRTEPSVSKYDAETFGRLADWHARVSAGLRVIDSAYDTAGPPQAPAAGNAGTTP
jgi:hypothetical protein